MKICVNCKTTFNTRKCKVCSRKSTIKYYLSNKEKRLSQSSKWKAENKDKVKANKLKWISAHRKEEAERVSKWRENNKETAQAGIKRWREENPDRLREMKRLSAHTRRARKKDVGGKLSTGITEKLFKLQRGRCACCKRSLGKNFQLDHKIPIVLGGANEDWNIQLLRKQCNNKKNSKDPIDFMQSKGYLL